MSAFEDELLALAERRDEPRKKKRAGGSPAKKVKQESDSDSGSAMDIESEEDDAPHYPLEGKYIDVPDRERLLNMSELAREQILSTRLEEIQKWKDKQDFKEMLKRRSGATDDNASPSKHKNKSLNDYTAARKAKEERKQTRRDRASPSAPSKSRRRGFDSDSDSDDDHRLGRDERHDKNKKKVHNVEINDLERIRLSRRKIAACMYKPWFKDYVVGAWVRYVVGEDDGRNVYRVCRIDNISEGAGYTLEGQRTTFHAEMVHGDSKRLHPLSAVSDSPFTDREFDRLALVCKMEKVSMPTLADINKKADQLHALENKVWTEEDVAKHLADKLKREGNRLTSTQFAVQRAGIRSAMQLAEKRGDNLEINDLKLKLDELEFKHADYVEATNKRGREDDDEDLVAKVNKRNRMLNEEIVRKSEAADAERRKRERRLKTGTDLGGRKSTSATPGGTPSRNPSFPTIGPLSIAVTPSSFANAAKEIEVDLGDF